MSTQQTPETFVADVVKGAVAGAIATWVMGKATTWFWEHESAASQAKYKEVTGEKRWSLL